MKNENAIMDRIKARIAYHANEHRHTYEIGKGVMDFLARDLLADFKAWTVTSMSYTAESR